MTNVPNNSVQNWDQLIVDARENIIKKLERILKTDIRPLIECEMLFDPRIIENRTSSALTILPRIQIWNALLRH